MTNAFWVIRKYKKLFDLRHAHLNSHYLPSQCKFQISLSIWQKKHLNFWCAIASLIFFTLYRRYLSIIKFINRNCCHTATQFLLVPVEIIICNSLLNFCREIMCNEIRFIFCYTKIWENHWVKVETFFIKRIP